MYKQIIQLLDALPKDESVLTTELASLCEQLLTCDDIDKIPFNEEQLMDLYEKIHLISKTYNKPSMNRHITNSMMAVPASVASFSEDDYV